MTIAVRPASRRSRPFSIVFSVRTSTLEVASSRIRMRGSASSARAKATSWRWPAESWTPRSPTSVSIPSGRAATKSVAPTAADRRFDLLEARLGPAEGDVFADAAGEEEALLGDDPELARAAPAAARRAGRGRRPARVPSAGRRSGRPAWRRSTCRRRSRRPAPASAPAARAGRRPRAPTRPVAGASLALGVGEPDAVHLDLAADRARVDRARRVDHVRLGVEQVEDLVERRHPLLVGRVELGEFLDRFEEGRQVADEGDDDADLDRPVDRLRLPP